MLILSKLKDLGNDAKLNPHLDFYLYTVQYFSIFTNNEVTKLISVFQQINLKTGIY